ncbi:ATP-dependent RecD-like DNA helicase [Patescibacteria group bacterium]|nr:ATP-dependent RecD-like DNA helicase [Patescibacteria group bacterium]
MDISSDKKLAIKKILNWYAKETGNKQFITLGGYAGTGKTTLIAILRKLLFKQDPKLKVAFAAFTGKAARVLKNYLKENEVLYKGDSIGTIHSLIYSVIENEQHEIIGWKNKEELKVDLIIIDEASMVDQKIWLDLLSYNIPILAVGDHGQLPPVNGQFNLMENPEIKLEEIHRQVADNPIIKLSIEARKYGRIKIGNYGKGVRKLSKSDPESQEIIENYLQQYNQDTLILCGYNNTRIKLNNYLRTLLGFESALPQAGDRVICLRNKQQKAIFNGMLGTLQRIVSQDENFYEVKISFDDEEQDFEGLAVKKQFGSTTALNFGKELRALTLKAELFDFAYALTVHKAQGSQASRVILFEERFKQMSDLDWRRWLYTAVTRAEDELIILGD